MAVPDPASWSLPPCRWQVGHLLLPENRRFQVLVYEPISEPQNATPAKNMKPQRRIILWVDPFYKSGKRESGKAETENLNREPREIRERGNHGGTEEKKEIDHG